jgi:hypothetical protein
MTARFFTRFSALFALLAIALAAIGCKHEPPKPGQAEFDSANGAIGSYSKDVGFGNNPGAVAIANKFAARVKKLEAESFTGGKDADNDSFTKGNFLTYCQMQGPDIVLLVQAPNLDTYEGDVRKALFEVAWEAAQDATGKPAGKNLVIALRGKLFYGALGKGKASADPPDPKIGTALEENQLYAYFVPPAK